MKKINLITVVIILFLAFPYTTYAQSVMTWDDLKKQQIPSYKQLREFYGYVFKSNDFLLGEKVSNEIKAQEPTIIKKMKQGIFEISLPKVNSPYGYNISEEISNKTILDINSKLFHGGKKITYKFNSKNDQLFCLILYNIEEAPGLHFLYYGWDAKKKEVKIYTDYDKKVSDYITVTLPGVIIGEKAKEAYELEQQIFYFPWDGDPKEKEILIEKKNKIQNEVEELNKWLAGPGFLAFFTPLSTVQQWREKGFRIPPL